MKKRIAWFLALFCLCGLSSIAQVEAPKPDNVIGDTEMRDAVTLAVAHVKAYLLLSKRTGPSEYRVIAAQNLLPKGLAVWLVTFKPTTLIPKDPDKVAIGAGGEFFVTVELTTKKCTMTHGE